MRAWDSIKKVWAEVTDGVSEAISAVQVGPGGVGSPEGGADDEYEIRHQAAYDHVTGVESMQPVRVKKSDVSDSSGVSPAGMR
jgi:hypothetical protein